MAYKNLTTEEMLALSGPWIDPKSPAHKAIMAEPDLAPSMKRMTAAHTALSAHSQPEAENPRVGEISTEQLSVDGRHDDIIRGSHALLTGISLLLGDNGGAAFVQLRDLLVPDGLQSTQKTYRAESGQAQQLETRLTAETRTQLASIVVGPKNARHTLEEFVNEWIQHGATLGTLEDEKARLQSAGNDAAGGAAVAARNTWIRNTTALVANGEAAELDREVDTLIFGPLRAHEKLTAHRAARPRGGAPGVATAPTASTPEAPTTK